jgi:uncharacterized membrane protein
VRLLEQRLYFLVSRWLCCGLLLLGLFFLIGGSLPPLAVKCGQPLLADWFYDVFSGSCQQQPTRTFWMLDYPMALCARCVGVYLGFSSSSVYGVFQQKVTVSGFFIVALVIVTFGEKALEWSNIWAGNNEIRFLSGIGLGFLIFLLVSWVIGFVMMRVKNYAVQYWKTTSNLD